MPNTSSVLTVSIYQMHFVELGIKPEFVVLKVDDPTGYAISTNLVRRHLCTGQRALVAARLMELEIAGAKVRKTRKAKSVPEILPVQKGDARDLVGKKTGVSGKTVEHALAVIRSDYPNMIGLVETGQFSVSAAAS